MVRSPQVSRPAQDRLSPGQQLGKQEWLDQIVVCPPLQRGHPFICGLLGAQDQNGGIDASIAKLDQQADAVQLGQHDVHDGYIIGDDLGHLQTLLAVQGVVHRKTGFAEALDNEIGNISIILDQ
jgi:hypothetical protein